MNKIITSLYFIYFDHFLLTILQPHALNMINVLAIALMVWVVVDIRLEFPHKVFYLVFPLLIYLGHVCRLFVCSEYLVQSHLMSLHHHLIKKKNIKRRRISKKPIGVVEDE